MKWWIILRISIEERLVYRGDFALGTLMRFAPIVTQIFLWGAIFDARQASGKGTSQIVGYSYQDMVAYYLLVMVGRAFSSMPGLASGIARDIRTGVVKKYLIQPIDMLGFLLLYRMAHKLVYYGVAAAPFALVFFLCRSFFPGWPDAPHIAGVLRIFDNVVPLGIFSGSRAGHDRVLVPGSQLPAFCLHAVQFLFFRTHVSPGHAAGRDKDNGKTDSISIPGIFSRRRFSGQNPRGGPGKRIVRAVFLGVPFFRRQSFGLLFTALNTTAGTGDEGRMRDEG